MLARKWLQRAVKEGGGRRKPQARDSKRAFCIGFNQNIMRSVKAESKGGILLVSGWKREPFISLNHFELLSRAFTHTSSPAKHLLCLSPFFPSDLNYKSVLN